MLAINGTFKQNLGKVEGDNAHGHWTRGGFIVEYGEEFSRKAQFSVMGDERVKMVESIPIGCPVQVDFVIESREFNGKWYTDLRCTKISIIQPQYQYIQQ